MWKKHRPECRRLQAIAFGEEYARKEDRGYRLTRFAFMGEIREMKRLIIELSVAVARTKFAKAVDAAMRTFLDFIDPRQIGTSAYGAAQMNRLEAMRLLHGLRADLDKPNTTEGGPPAGIVAQFGHTAMVQLLYDLGADVHRARPDGTRPILGAAGNGHVKTVFLLLSLRADVNTRDNEGRSACWKSAYQGHAEVISTLLNARADVNATAQGYSPADVAKHNGHKSALEILLRAAGLPTMTAGE